MTSQRFETWNHAFDTCREVNAPMVVTVDGETLKIFPSGHSVDPYEKRNGLIDARLAAGLKAHEASMRRSRLKVWRLRCSYFIDKHGDNWREEMARAAKR